MSKNFKIIFVGITLLVTPVFVSAVSLGQEVNFFVKSDYDSFQREEISATLKTIGEKAYFYVDNKWWDILDSQKKERVEQSLRILDSEFHNRIYPKLTTIFGSEWIPGIDNDLRITILIHPMKGGVGGYFNSGDEYPRLQVPNSNQKEMVYLNANQIDNPQLKAFLAHEFMHLITFNQKDKIQGISEETWLNEARSEYAPTLLGYDDEYEGSNLQRRVSDFLAKPSDSLTEWKNEKADYGILNLFTQYLVEHYGAKVLIDSLKLKTVGIESLNQALAQNYFEEDFSQIFTDWTIAIFVNDCSLGEKYCYKNENLKEIRVTPSINFLPLHGKSTLGVSQTTKNWAGNWHKFIGGKGVLKFEFSSLAELNFKVPYLVQDKEGKYSIYFLTLDKNQKGEIYIQDFNTENKSLTIIPSLQTKISGFDGPDPTYPFTFTVSILERTPEEEAELIKELLAQIEFLKAEIVRLQAQINAILVERGQQQGVAPCRFETDLYFGMMNNDEVRCLQEFLKAQGPEIYPEALVTGNFLTLTKTAAIRFQEKYANEILSPLGLEKGTGFFGPSTRTKINQLLGY